MQRLESESGDFIILRRDGLIAYQLAVVVDDHLQGVTHVVRGIDLIDSTPRQLWLQQLLGYATPNYCHIPVAVNAQGQKLSKNHGARAVHTERVAETLLTALHLLGQQPSSDLQSARVAEIWQWARANWNIEALVGQTQIAADADALARARNGLS
jgi:glutamyl-Q tRNA(Asp) synthetase